jgi:hypothetical protein
LHGFTFSFQDSFMSLMGQVNIVDRWSVASKFSWNGTFVTSETFGYVLYTFALGTKICNFISLFAGEVLIGLFYHTLRINRLP